MICSNELTQVQYRYRMKNDLDILYIVLMKTWYDDQTIMFCNADDGNIVRNLNPSSKDEASISMYYEKIENYSGSTFKITFELSEGMDYLYIVF